MRRFLIGVLAGWLVLFSGLVHQQLAAHATHHAHHQKATHSTILCSWMCAAGQMLDGLQLVPQTRFDLLAFNFTFDFQSPFSEPTESPTSRGPPVFSI